MILFTASNFTFSQTKPIFNLILCIMLGIFSLSLFVLAFVIGRKMDMITFIAGSLIFAVATLRLVIVIMLKNNTNFVRIAILSIKYMKNMTIVLNVG